MITSLLILAGVAVVFAALAAVLYWLLGPLFRSPPAEGDDLMALADTVRRPEAAPFDVDAWEEAWEKANGL